MTNKQPTKPTRPANAKQTTPANEAAPSLPRAFELLKPSWAAVRLNLITLIEFIVIPIVLSVLSAFLFQRHSNVSTTLRTGLSYSYSTTTTQSYGSGWYAANGLSVIVSLLFAPGIIYTLLQGAKEKSVDFLAAFQVGLKFFWRYIGVALCSGFLVVLGFILLIVPGVIMLRRYYLAPYYLIDRDLGVFETLRVSASESKRFSGSILGVLGLQALFALIVVILFFIPILGLILGGILSIMYYNAPAIRYLQITKAQRS